jgi:mono/diheme cytochrome c family protein
MNRQVDYIVHAGILLSLMCGILFVVNSVSVSSSSPQNNISVNETPVPGINMTEAAAKGKTLFMSKCASCHNIFKDATGPGLIGFTERGPWAERKNIYAWIRNPQKFMQTNEYTRGLQQQYNAVMTAFPDMSNEEIDAVIEYINFADSAKTTALP